MRSRGTDTTADASIGFRVLRLSEAGVENVWELYTGDVVTFTYSNRTHAWRYIQVVALPELGAPFVAGDGSRAIVADATDEPLPLVLRVDDSLGATIELFAIFTQAPLDGAVGSGDAPTAVTGETFTIQAAP